MMPNSLLKIQKILEKAEKAVQRKVALQWRKHRRPFTRGEKVEFQCIEI